MNKLAEPFNAAANTAQSAQTQTQSLAHPLMWTSRQTHNACLPLHPEATDHNCGCRTCSCSYPAPLVREETHKQRKGEHKRGHGPKTRRYHQETPGPPTQQANAAANAKLTNCTLNYTLTAAAAVASCTQPDLVQSSPEGTHEKTLQGYLELFLSSCRGLRKKRQVRKSSEHHHTFPNKLISIAARKKH